MLTVKPYHDTVRRYGWAIGLASVLALGRVPNSSCSPRATVSPLDLIERAGPLITATLVIGWIEAARGSGMWCTPLSA